MVMQRDPAEYSDFGNGASGEDWQINRQTLLVRVDRELRPAKIGDRAFRFQELPAQQGLAITFGTEDR